MCKHLLFVTLRVAYPCSVEFSDGWFVFSLSLSLSHSFSHSLILSLLHSPLRMIHQAQKRKCAHESKVLKLARDDHRVWQTGFTSSELAPLLEKLRSEARAAKMQGFLADSPTASRSSARRLLACRWAAARSSACFEPAHICSRRMPQSCVATGRPLKSSRSVKDSIFLHMLKGPGLPGCRPTAAAASRLSHLLRADRVRRGPGHGIFISWALCKI